MSDKPTPLDRTVSAAGIGQRSRSGLPSADERQHSEHSSEDGSYIITHSGIHRFVLACRCFYLLNPKMGYASPAGEARRLAASPAPLH